MKTIMKKKRFWLILAIVLAAAYLALGGSGEPAGDEIIEEEPREEIDYVSLGKAMRKIRTAAGQSQAQYGHSE